MENVKLFQKNVGEFFIATVLYEDDKTMTCENYFMIVANVVKNPDGEGYRVTLTMLPDDIIHQSPAIFFRTFYPEMSSIPLVLQKESFVRIMDEVPERIIADYKNWISKLEQSTSTKAVSVPESDESKTIKLFN